MICYIKRFKDFKTIDKFEITGYSISDGEDGSINVDCGVSAKTASIYRGCWLVLPFYEKENSDLPFTYTFTTLSDGGIAVDIVGDDLDIQQNISQNNVVSYDINSSKVSMKHKVFYISECSPESDHLSFTIKHPIYAFDRRVQYGNETTWGPLIKNTINNYFGINCSDSNYALRYISVSGDSSKECTINPDQFGYIVPYEYFVYAREAGVNIDFSVIDNNKLLISISDSSDDYGVVVFNDGHSQLADETYSSNIYSKVTILQELQDQGAIIASSNSQIINNYNASFSIQVSQSISGSYISKKTGFLVRVVSEWIAYSEKIEFKNCALNVWLNDSSGTSLANTTFEWTLNTEPGISASSWFELSNINISNTYTLYVEIVPDRYPNEVAQESYNTFSYTIEINSSDVISYSEVKFGPYDRDYNQTMYRTSDFYLTEEGYITTIPTSNLAEGTWIVGDISGEDSPLEAAAEIFSQNSENHKIEFYSDKYFEYFQPIRMRIRNGVFDSIIVSRTITDTDGRYYYKCGKMLTRLTEKVDALISGKS